MDLTLRVIGHVRSPLRRVQMRRARATKGPLRPTLSSTTPCVRRWPGCTSVTISWS